MGPIHGGDWSLKLGDLVVDGGEAAIANGTLGFTISNDKLREQTLYGSNKSFGLHVFGFCYALNKDGEKYEGVDCLTKDGRCGGAN